MKKKKNMYLQDGSESKLVVEKMKYIDIQARNSLGASFTFTSKYSDCFFGYTNNIFMSIIQSMKDSEITSKVFLLILEETDY